VAEILKATMEGVHKLPVTLKVDVKVGNSWGEL
jgi:DNA polymerase I-like protein with 3'-5' exonuclease and polymerase domains